MTRIEQDGRNWLRRPKLCTKSCRAVIRGKKRETEEQAGFRANGKEYQDTRNISWG
jgi:hypothetical protein